MSFSYNLWRGLLDIVLPDLVWKYLHYFMQIFNKLSFNNLFLYLIMSIFLNFLSFIPRIPFRLPNYFNVASVCFFIFLLFQVLKFLFIIIFCIICSFVSQILQWFVWLIYVIASYTSTLCYQLCTFIPSLWILYFYWISYKPLTRICSFCVTCNFIIIY